MAIRSTAVNVMRRLAVPVKTKVKALDERTYDVCCPAVTAAPLDEADATDLARVLSALADPVRLRLLSIVASSPEVCSCDLENPLGKSQPTVSHHTKVLADAGLISGERRGKWTWWHANPDRLAAIRTALGG
ncbi:MAG TPA: metalloregulator ArsR/SmtB family transcription factor [Streptosporangiaceae bacterium]|nr:metalloregulator ArsR/SmtB family transcription factor [Streptosporangiaceae bacterium]